MRQSVRALLKAPGFSLTVIVTLALGIGANTAIFTVINAVLLRPLPYADADRLVDVLEVLQDRESNGGSSIADLRDFQARARTVDLAGLCYSTPNLTGGDLSERVSGVDTTGNFFSVLGVRPFLGRVYGEGDDRRDSTQVAVISYRLWQRVFHGDPTVVGRAMTLNGDPATLIGILPKEFAYPWDDTDLWAPFANQIPAESMTQRGSRFYSSVARLRPGVSVEAAHRDLAAVAAELARDFPQTNAGWTVKLVPTREAQTKSVRMPLLLIGGAVALVLLIACVNLGGLFLSRAMAARREFAVRAALGASQGRLLQHALFESAMLAFSGSALGFWIAHAGLKALLALAPEGISRLNEVSLDLRVLFFTSAATLGSSLLFTGFTALARPKDGLRAALQAQSATATETGGLQRMRESLLVLQIALAMVLLLGAGLLAVSFKKLLALDLGFRSERTLALHAVLSGPKYASVLEQKRYAREALQAVLQTPGVEAAAFTGKAPLDSNGPTVPVPFAIEGQEQDDARADKLGYRAADPGFFSMLGIRVLEGRGFLPEDRDGAPHVLLVNRAFANRYFPKGAVGKRVRFVGEKTDADWHTIVGVLADIHSWAVDQEDRPVVWEPASQRSFDWMSWVTIVARTRGDPASMVQPLKRAMGQVDPALPVFGVISLQSMVDRSLAPRRFALSLAAALTAVALLLMMAGVYGVFTAWVAQRTREIGIRMALGARDGQILRLVVGRGALLTLLGMALGSGLALASGRLLSSLVFGVSTTDPLSFAACASFEIGAALLACWGPARRALSVDPMAVLRAE
jgi:putative ABC transport system permease protein